MPPISRKGTEEEASSPTQRTCTLWRPTPAVARLKSGDDGEDLPDWQQASCLRLDLRRKGGKGRREKGKRSTQEIRIHLLVAGVRGGEAIVPEGQRHLLGAQSGGTQGVHATRALPEDTSAAQGGNAYFLRKGKGKGGRHVEAKFALYAAPDLSCKGTIHEEWWAVSGSIPQRGQISLLPHPRIWSLSAVRIFLCINVS
uniref:Uncharacterized protein n=1 Tax=Oryza glumipatula TaxID=40148 RepID=A0A0D9Y6M1_9ORYZ